MFLLSYPPLLEHHILPLCPTYLCMPGKKYFGSISIPIAYDSGCTVVSSGAEKCSFEKSPRRAWRLPTSIFDAVAHFVCLPQESQPSPTGGLATLASQLSGPFPAPAHCHPVCGSAAPLQAREQSKLMPYYSSTLRANGAVVAFNEKSSSVLGFMDFVHCGPRFWSSEFVSFNHFTSVFVCV